MPIPVLFCEVVIFQAQNSETNENRTAYSLQTPTIIFCMGLSKTFKTKKKSMPTSHNKKIRQQLYCVPYSI